MFGCLSISKKEFEEPKPKDGILKLPKNTDQSQRISKIVSFFLPELINSEYTETYSLFKEVNRGGRKFLQL